jgi:hypothetical protein
MRPPFALVSFLIAALVSPATAVDVAVTTADDVVDAGDGLLSLREAIADANAEDTVKFDFDLDGGTITTTGGTLVIDKNLTIDASELPAGIRFDAQLNHRLLDIQAGSTLTIEGVSLLNGRTTNQNGGCARVLGNLTMRGCLVSGCIGGFGGGLFASGAVVVDCENCTFSGNKCRNGGSAVAGNSGADFILRHCTIYNNTGFNSGMAIGAGSGGYFFGAGTTTTLGHTVFGENRDGAGNLFTGFYANGASTTSEGYNCLDQSGGPGAQPTDLVNTDPMLGPLEYWGGKTECHRPLQGSPLIDAGDPAIATPPLRDQIFGPRLSGIIDIGAIERGIGSFEQWCEFFGVTPDPNADDDGDLSTQLFEYAYDTNPDDSGDNFHITSEIDEDSVFRTYFQYNLDHGDVIHFMDRSDDLDIWVQALTSNPANAAILGFNEVSYPDFSAGERRFHRSRPYLGRPQ